jgi:hypothetical protein
MCEQMCDRCASMCEYVRVCASMCEQMCEYNISIYQQHIYIYILIAHTRTSFLYFLVVMVLDLPL